MTRVCDLTIARRGAFEDVANQIDGIVIDTAWGTRFVDAPEVVR